MRYILTAEQMKASDTATINEIGIPSLVLMERAALRCVEVMKEEQIDLTKPLVVCGSGNNGGDGFAVARLLYEEGYLPEIAFVGNRNSRSEETRTQMEILENLGMSYGNSLPDAEYSVIIDAVFGIGLSREVKGHYRDVIERMNRYKGAKVAIDIASGISADTGQVLGCAFRADLTVTFAYGKLGQYLFPGSTFSGKTVVRPIGIKNMALENSTEVSYMFESSDLKNRMPKRYADSNKGTYGRVLLIAGSKGMSGAAYLAAKAAYLTGAGLVRIYTEESNRQILQQLLPEAVLTTYIEPDKAGEMQAGKAVEEQTAELLGWADVVCIGCGLGVSECSKALLKTVLKNNAKPCVIDADGLNILAGFSAEEKIQYRLNEKCYILTPHMKEMSRLTGETVENLKKERKKLLREFVKKVHVVCALKDSRTLVAAPDKALYLNTTGNSAMSKGGAGDVLAGVITGLLAQGLAVYEAASLGVYLHGLAGDAARDKKGGYSVLAGDIAEALAEILLTLEDE